MAGITICSDFGAQKPVYDISDFQMAKSKNQLLYLTIFGPFSSLESPFPSPFSSFFLPSWTWNIAVSIATHLSDHIPVNLKTINRLTFLKFLFPAQVSLLNFWIMLLHIYLISLANLTGISHLACLRLNSWLSTLQHICLPVCPSSSVYINVNLSFTC